MANYCKGNFAGLAWDPGKRGTTCGVTARVLWYLTSDQFLKGGGNIEALRAFLMERGGRVALAGLEKEAAALRDLASNLGRSLHVGDSRVAASAAREAAPVITNDGKFQRFLNAIGMKGIGF